MRKFVAKSSLLLHCCNLIQFNTDICTRQLINYARWRARSNKNNKMSVSQVRISRKKWVFNLVLKLFNERSGSRRCTGRHCAVSSRLRTKQSRTQADLTSWFSSGDRQRSFKCHRWSQLSVHRGECAEIRQIVRTFKHRSAKSCKFHKFTGVG